MNQQQPFAEGRVMSSEEVARMEERREAAKRAALLTPGTRTEHLRLSIDFHITVAGTPPDDDGLNEPDPVYHGRQARLLAAVRSNPDVLKRWMVDLIVSQMLQKGEAYWEALTGGEVALQDLLAPALAALPEDDQEYFADTSPLLTFDDVIDLFRASFIVEEDAPVITDDHDVQGS